MQITQTIIHFPDIRLKTRDAQKLRGYFGNLFKEHSPLLHNHYQDGTTRFAYPLVQYKVIKNVPMLVGLEEGADLLISLFLKIRELDIEGEYYPVSAKNIHQTRCELAVNQQLYDYSFETLWMALNQDNFRKYVHLDEEQKGVPESSGTKQYTKFLQRCFFPGRWAYNEHRTVGGETNNI